MAPLAPASDLVARFRRDLENLIGEPDRLGVAVSGGPDSLALLLLAHAAYGERVRAATVDHRLRAESREEARFVARICAALGIDHAHLETRVDQAAASLQQEARRARYQALDIWLVDNAIGWLATAHHADDQAETLMMRLLRGSGVGGLAGVRAVAPVPAPLSAARVVRPLLGWRRSELRAIVDRAGIAPVEDPSNDDPRFDRARIRGALAGTPWIDPLPLARSAAALAEADRALEWSAARLWDERVEARDGRFGFDPEGIPDELRRRILRRLFRLLGSAGSAPRGDELGRLLETLQAGRAATLAGVKCAGGTIWRFEPAPPRRPTRQP